MQKPFKRPSIPTSIAKSRKKTEATEPYSRRPFINVPRSIDERGVTTPTRLVRKPFRPVRKPTVTLAKKLQPALHVRAYRRHLHRSLHFRGVHFKHSEAFRGQESERNFIRGWLRVRTEFVPRLLGSRKASMMLRLGFKANGICQRGGCGLALVIAPLFLSTVSRVAS